MVLERRARAEKLSFQDVQRARVVLYAAEGLADTEIARDWTRRRVWSGGGEDGRRAAADGLKDQLRAGRPRRFPPEQVAAVKVVACERRFATGCRSVGSRGLSCTGW